MLEKVTIELREGQTYNSSGGAVDVLRCPFLSELEAEVGRQGAEAKRNFHCTSYAIGESVPRKKSVPRKDGTGDYLLQYVTNASDLLTIGLVGAAATAAFARNVIGMAKDWIELTKNTKRSVKVTIGDKVVEIKQGDDIRDLLQKYFPDDGTSTPL